MRQLTETTAELLLVRRSFVPGVPGFVGARIGVAGRPTVPDGRHRLRHGHLDVRAGRATVSVPPSPGVEIAIRRAADDLAVAGDLVTPDPVNHNPINRDPVTGDGDATTGDRPATTGVRVTLDAGTAGRGTLSYRSRWVLAHTLGPVLHSIFGAPAVTVPPALGGDPRADWARTVLDAPDADGRTFRQRLRANTRPAGAGSPTRDDLGVHTDSLTFPVRARGHLELDVAADLPDDGWMAALAVTAVLFDDPTAAEEASIATRLLDRPGGESPWTRAASCGLADPELAEAARACLFAAYDALARHQVTRPIRQAVAAVADRSTQRARSFEVPFRR